MRYWPGVAALVLAANLPGADKLTMEDRVELTRGLTAEYATVKQFLPRSKKPLDFEADGTWDKKKWEQIGKEFGPAARVGDLVQITKIEIEENRLVLQINGGMRGRRKWYEGVQIGMGNSTTPVATGNSNAPSGTTIAILFHKQLAGMKAAEIKKLLAPVLDFEKRSATEIYSETLKPEVRQAIQAKRRAGGHGPRPGDAGAGAAQPQVARDQGRDGAGGLGLRHAAGEDRVRHLQREQGRQGEGILRRAGGGGGQAGDGAGAVNGDSPPRRRERREHRGGRGA